MTEKALCPLPNEGLIPQTTVRHRVAVPDLLGWLAAADVSSVQGT